MRAFRSEWTKFLRPGQLLGSWGTMAGFGVLLALLLLSNAKDVPAVQQQAGGGPPAVPLSLFAGHDGGAFAFQATGQLLGIIALVVAAANVATEYTSGTFKVLLVHEPRRTLLFSGKLLALWAFILSGIVLTLLLSVGASAAVAAARGLDTGPWWSADGLADLGKALCNVTAAAFVWALMGAMLAVLFRSGFPAIGIGIAYPLVVEGLLGLVLPDVVKYMPGAVLGKLAAGSAAALSQQPTIGYGTAAVLAVAYAVVFAAVAFLVLERRDVT